MLLRYLRALSMPRVILWCYLIWYLNTVARYFDPSVKLWLSSVGISAIIGTGLYLSTAYSGSGAVHLGRWQLFRLYLMPFCVSSFAALIKGKEFILVFHPNLAGNLSALGACGGFVLLVQFLKWSERPAGFWGRVLRAR